MKHVLWIPVVVLCVVAGGNRYDSFADVVNDKGLVVSGFLIAAVLAAVMIVVTEAWGKRKERNDAPR
jgi:hypothetical protein